MYAKDTQQGIGHPPVPLPNKILPHVWGILVQSPTADDGEQLEVGIRFIACQVKDRPKLWNEKRFLYVAKMQK